MGTLNSAPTAPGALPLLGHALPLLRDPLRFLNFLPSRGDVVAVRIGPFKAMVVFFITNRYTEPGNPGDPIQAPRLAMPPFAEQPADTNPQPLSIPTIAWWWEQLR